MIYGESLYQQTTNGMLLLCLDRDFVDRAMTEVHAEVCGPHMSVHMLSRKIMRTSYFWLTVGQFVVGLYKDTQSVRCVGISYMFHHQNYMHWAHLGHFQSGHRHYQEDFSQVFQWSWVHFSRHLFFHEVDTSCFLCKIDLRQGSYFYQTAYYLSIWGPSWVDIG